MMRKPLWLLAALVMAGCSGQKPNVEPPAPLNPIEAEFTPQEQWTWSSGAENPEGVLRLQPWLDDDSLVLADAGGDVVAYDAAAREMRWRVDLDRPLTAGVGGGEGLLLVATREGEVIALEAADGRERWRAQTSSAVYAAPVVYNGRVAVRVGDGRLFMFDSETGERLWVDGRSVPRLSLHGSSRPLMVEGGVIAGFDSGKLVAFAEQDGRVIWETTVAVPRGRSELERMVDVDAAPLLADGALFAVAYQGRLVALDGQRGRIIWARDMSGFKDMQSDGQRLFLTDAEDDLWAIDMRSGAALWKSTDFHARRLTSPELHGDYVVVGDLDGYLHWISKTDGHEVARVRAGSDPLTALKVSGERLYAVNDEGRVTVFGLPAER